MAAGCFCIIVISFLCPHTRTAMIHWCAHIHTQKCHLPACVCCVSVLLASATWVFKEKQPSSLHRELVPPHLLQGKLLVLLRITMAPCPRFSSQLSSVERCTNMYSLSRNTPSFHMGIPLLQWLMCCHCLRWEYWQIWCSQKSDILQELNKVNCTYQKGSIYPIWFSLR